MKTGRPHRYTVRLTGFAGFGASPGDVLAGQRPIPFSGVRAGLSFERNAQGRFAGAIHSADYFYLRPDGRMELDIRATRQTAREDAMTNPALLNPAAVAPKTFVLPACAPAEPRRCARPR